MTYLTWPEPDSPLEESLDIGSVKHQTGCDDSDYHELCRVFMDEGNNMLNRLSITESALLKSTSDTDLIAAADLLYASAHELSSSFGIIGARVAESYARATQLKVRYKTNRASTQDIPSKENLIKANSFLIAAVQNCLSILKKTVTA